MSYTVGVKRRFWFGYRRVMVTGHDWQNGRFILNRTDGAQEHIPGFSAPVVRVYPDFWTHISKMPPVPRPAPVAVVAKEPEPIPVAEEAFHVEPESPQMQEVRRRAAERVRSILDGAH